MVSFARERKRLIKKISRALGKFFHCKGIDDFEITNELSNGKLFEDLRGAMIYCIDCYINCHSSKGNH